MRSKRSKDPVPSLLSSADSRVRRQLSEGLGFWHECPIPCDPRPGQAVTIKTTVGINEQVQSVWLSYTTDGADPRVESPSLQTLSMTLARTVWNASQWAYVEEYEAEIPAQTEGTIVRYVIGASRSGGETIYVPHLSREDEAYKRCADMLDHAWIYHAFRQGEPMVHQYRVDNLRVADWLEKAVIYQIIPDRFAAETLSESKARTILKGHGGGTLKGLTQRLGYLSDLGINCLWLTPIFPSPSHHGYDCTDFGSIEPRLGTMKDWDDLVRECRSRKIRILLDLAANHVSDQHPAFQAAIKEPADEHKAWFRFSKWPDQYDSYALLRTFPILETENDQVREHVFSECAKWLERGCDGFRLDHAHGVSHAFWSEFRHRMKLVAPDSVMIGEVSYPPAGQLSFEGRMDGVLDFRLCELLRLFIVERNISVRELDRQLSRHSQFFAGRMVNPTFFDNHDVNRLLFLVNGDIRKVHLASILQFTMPGPPIIYYGTETALSQRKAAGRLEEARLPFPKESIDPGMHSFFKRLIEVRKKLLPFLKHERKTLQAPQISGPYVFAIGDCIVVLNNNPEQFTVPIAGASAELLLATQPEVLFDGVSVILPAYSGAIISGCAV